MAKSFARESSQVREIWRITSDGVSTISYRILLNNSTAFLKLRKRSDSARESHSTIIRMLLTIRERFVRHIKLRDPISGQSNQGQNLIEISTVYTKRQPTRRSYLLTVEYKPPHKVSTDNIKAGFRNMRLKDEVINRSTIPAGGEEKLQYNADRLVAAIATQTYHYMVENRLKYSYITTGEAIVFLYIAEEDPTILCYHVTVLKEDVKNEEADLSFSLTAVSQVLSFCLMAFKSIARRGHPWRTGLVMQLEKWNVDYQQILREIPESERKETPSSAGYYARKAQVMGSFELRSRNIQCRPRSPIQPLDDPSNDSDQAEPSPSKSKNQKGKRVRSTTKKTRGKARDASKNRGGSSRHKNRQYCSQKCLLGLVLDLPIDESCPNAQSHPRLPGRPKHAINDAGLRRLVRKQLAADVDNDFDPLGIQGARGALFKVTLASHGYVLVAKGTVWAYEPHLLHEGKTYKKLSHLQGTAVPVCLGNISLAKSFNLDYCVEITYLLLLSWGGERFDNKKELSLQREVQQTVAEVKSAGVSQEDVRTPNLLWNDLLGRVVLVDFERALWMQPVKEERRLEKMPSERKRKKDTPSEVKAKESSRRRALLTPT